MASVAFPELSKTISVNDGTKYGYIKVEPKEGKPTLLFLHGYPSSSYHWHYQVKQVQDEGYGAVIPDLLGYGDTDHPEHFEAYDNTVIARQVIDILDHEGLQQVVGIAHDWGSNLLSVVARHYASRFTLFIWMAVGYSPSQAGYTDLGDAIDKRALSVLGRPVLGYWYFHNEPEAASLIDNADPESVATLFYPADPDSWKTTLCAPGGMASWIRENKKGQLAPWMSPEQAEMQDKIMKMSGWTGPLNWYKQAIAGVTARSEANVTDEQKKIKIPNLYIGAQRDVICVAPLQEAGMKPFAQDLTVKNINTGHWLMMEKPDETWALVDEFIKAKLRL